MPSLSPNPAWFALSGVRLDYMNRQGAVLASVHTCISMDERRNYYLAVFPEAKGVEFDTKDEAKRFVEVTHELSG